MGIPPDRLNPPKESNSDDQEETLIAEAIKLIEDDCEYRHEFYKNGGKAAIEILKSLLPKYQEQLKSAYVFGKADPERFNNGAEEYYKKTFKPFQSGKGT